MDYLKDGAEIYRRSFATIRAEADLARLPDALQEVAVRMIHSSGMTDLVADLAFSDDFATAARTALERGGAVLCDTQMVASGITRTRLPADNMVRCFLDMPDLAAHARAQGTTRSAAALDFWRPHMAGALAVIGNAPTALFRLLELLDDGFPPPAAIIGVPVGFVGAVESKQELARHSRGVPFLTLLGRRGGSAIAAGAVNALARPEPAPS